jgi:hypothetical protein
MPGEPLAVDPPAREPRPPVRPAGPSRQAGSSRPRRWPWAAGLLAILAVAVALVWIPAWTMRPFVPQSAAAMGRAYALRRLAPAATLAALAAAMAFAWRLWGSTRWMGRLLVAAALAGIGAAAWVARQNHFEWLFPPLRHTGFAPPAAAAAFVDAGDLVLAIQVQGDAAAYPVRQIAYHHLVEDVVGGTPVAVTY